MQIMCGWFTPLFHVESKTFLTRLSMNIIIAPINISR